jgi:putative iron-dependent peroxidase
MTHGSTIDDGKRETKMPEAQGGILDAVPPLARYLNFRAQPQADAAAALRALRELVDGQAVVVGIGASLLPLLGRRIEGLRTYAAGVAPGIDLPAAPAALWCWLRGEDRGDLLHATRRIEDALGSGFVLQQAHDAFRHHRGLDLSGYEDGTENPTGEDALQAALVSGQGPGLDGSSFVAVQPWVHDFGRLEAMSQQQRDDCIGRRRSDNAELDDAPASAHVKRTAQESFTPEAFVLRRSMPWSDAQQAGLVFVAFGRSFDAFEAQWRRMTGAEDGITDALFGFTRPVGGAYFWCPPMRGGRLDLRALGL